MPILSGLPISVTPGTPSPAITFSPSALIADMNITSPFWSVSTNWKTVNFQYSDDTKSQSTAMEFDI